MKICHCLLVFAALALVSCVEETNDGDDDHDDTRSDNDRSCHQRGLSNPGSACGSRRDRARLARTAICLDTWLLALDRDQLCMGIRKLGLAAAASRCLGAGPLGEQSRRLGLDRGSLAVNPPSIAPNHHWTLLAPVVINDLDCFANLRLHFQVSVRFS
jgi:hypothetical protein